MTLKTFYFNPYRECTYVLSDAEKHAIVIDAGMYDEREQQRLRPVFPDKLLNAS